MAADYTKGLKPSVGRHRLAADIYVALVQKYGVLRQTPTEAGLMAKAAYDYADAFTQEGDKRQ